MIIDNNNFEAVTITMDKTVKQCQQSLVAFSNMNTILNTINKYVVNINQLVKKNQTMLYNLEKEVETL